MALSLLFCLVLIFFARLFYPTSQLLVTPDFGRSDAWHFSMPTKFVLSESLKHGELPLWRYDAGTGFPIFAEGQTGALFLPNLLLFSWLPWTTAYNVLLTFSVCTLGAGIYFLLRILGVSLMGTFFGAITMSFSGLTIAQLPHISLLQGMSLLPFIVGTGILALAKNTLFHYAIVVLLITQQLFVGFPQAVFLTMCILYAYALYQTMRTKQYIRFVFLIIATITGLMGSAAQLLPSYEFLKASTNPTGFDQSVASMFSMPLSHLRSFINPFVFGNPKFGTYPPFYRFDDSIFWENTAYLGMFPLLFAGFWFIKNKSTDRLFYSVLILGSILLAWGKHSPLYLLYGIWPLTLFRAPSRFLWITSISLILVASTQLSLWWNLSKNTRVKGLLLAIVFLQTIVLMSTWWSYHLLLPADTLLTKPPQVPEKSVRITTIGEPLIHNRTFTTTGWSKPVAFEYLYRGLSPVSNMLYNASSYGIYAGRFLKRQSLYNDLLTQEIQLSQEEATLSATAISLFSSSGVQEVHSFISIHNDALLLTNTIGTTFPLYIYKNTKSLPQAYIATTATTAATLRGAEAILRNPDFAIKKSVLLSDVDGNTTIVKDAIAHMSERDESIPITITRPTHTRTVITLMPVDTPTLLVLSDTFYPLWKATVDGKETAIIPANLTYRAVVVPAGGKEVIFSYKPQSVMRGIQVSMGIHALIMIAIAFHFLIVISRIRKKV